MGSEWSDVLEPEGDDWFFELWAFMWGIVACFM